jgi:hypothetical protein
VNGLCRSYGPFMRHLSRGEQDQASVKSMKKPFSAAVRQSGRFIDRETTAGPNSERLEVNVVFTETQTTAAALKAAESLAQGLEACILVRAAIIVPHRLSLDRPPVSVCFFQKLLRDLVSRRDRHDSDLTVQLYICRDWFATLLQVLKPNSLVVIGGRKHLWPTRASRLARALRATGHRVVFVDIKQQTGSLR